MRGVLYGILYVPWAGRLRSSTELQRLGHPFGNLYIRRQPMALRKTVQEEIHKMLENKVIRPKYESMVSTYIIMVQKEGGNWRFYIDFRKLNSVTHKDAYPLPRIDETLESLAGFNFFSTLDLASGYWQAELKEADKEKTAHWKVILSSMSCLLTSPMLHPVFKGYNDVYSRG